MDPAPECQSLKEPFVPEGRMAKNLQTGAK